MQNAHNIQRAGAFSIFPESRKTQKALACAANEKARRVRAGQSKVGSPGDQGIMRLYFMPSSDTPASRPA